MIKKLIKVTWLPKENNLCEIYQSVTMQFAFMSSQKEGYKQCNTFCKCRDFLHDIVRAQIQKTSMSIYGMAFDVKTSPKVDITRMRMLVKMDVLKTQEDFANFEVIMQCARKLINHFEKLAGCTTKTRVSKVEGNDKVWLFIGPGMWMKSPFLVSLFTFLIRIGHKKITFKGSASLAKSLKTLVDSPSKDANGREDVDVTYLKEMWNKIPVVMANLHLLGVSSDAPYAPVFNSKDSISNFHNKGGIKSLCTSNTFDADINKSMTKLFKEAGVNG